MLRRMPFITRLRRSRCWGWVGFWLIILQVFAAAEHMSAMAATTTGVPQDGQLGFLNICTAQGIASLAADPQDTGQQDSVTGACALCTMDCMAGHAVLAAPSITLSLPAKIRPEKLTAGIVRLTPHLVLRFGTVRGPPFSTTD